MGVLHPAMWSRRAAALLIAAPVLFARTVYGGDCEKDAFRLGGQGDADALSDCPTLTGDVIVAATAEGSINLEGVETIRGNLSNEDCFDGATDDDSNRSLLESNFGGWEDCRGLESLSAKDLVHVTGDVTLRSLLDITEVDFKNLEAINGTLRVDYLPHLERMNFSRLELAESVFIRHDRQLVNLTMSDIKNITAKDSVIELVDLGIYEWPHIKIRHHYWDEKPRRRLERLLAKDLPNVELFEFNNADEFGLLEVHGLSNQTAQINTDFQPAGPTPDDPFTETVLAIDNFTMVGFGGDFFIDFPRFVPADIKTDIQHVHFVNNTMKSISLADFGKTQTLYLADNSELEELTMPDMLVNDWQALHFSNNSRLSFGGDNLINWDWGLNSSTFSIKGSPVSAEWVKYMSARITQSLVIDPSGNSTEACVFIQECVKEGEVVVPDKGYACGGKHYESAGVHSAMFSSAVLITVACVVTLISGGWTS